MQYQPVVLISFISIGHIIYGSTFEINLHFVATYLPTITSHSFICICSFDYRPLQSCPTEGPYIHKAGSFYPCQNGCILMYTGLNNEIDIFDYVGTFGGKKSWQIR